MTEQQTTASSKYSEVNLLNHTRVLFSFFWGNSTLFSIVGASMHKPIKSAWGFPFLPSHQHLLSVVFTVIAILIGVRRHLTVFGISISLMTNDVEHLFMCLLAICMSSLEKYLFRSFAHFLIGCFVFWCWVVWVLCVFWIPTSYQIYHLKISSLIQ